MAEEKLKKVKKNNKKNNNKKNEKELLELKKEIQNLKSKLEKQEVMLKEEKEKRIRAIAEMENFKKRMIQEKEQFVKFANESLIKEFLPALDSFDYAIEHATTDEDKKKDMLEGFMLIQKQMHQAMEKVGVVPIKALNKPFDPNFHQAMMQEENKEVEPNIVLKEMQKGYLIGDRVLRPAMVVVSK